MINRLTRNIIFLLIAVFVISCGKDYYNEKRAGPYKITKAEISYYSKFSKTPDSVFTYSTPDMGYFNFYNSSPPLVYVIINYPSRFFSTDYSATYEVHEENHEVLTLQSKRITVSHYNSNNQEWNLISDDYNGNAVREMILVEKQ